MALPRRASALRTLRLICEVLEDRVQPAVGPIASLATNDYVPDHILVQFKPDVTPQPILGTTITSSLSLVPGLYDIQLPEGLSVAQALEAYNADSQVVTTQPDYLIQAEALPNDPSFNQQWALNTSSPTASISATTAWNTSTGTGNTIVATIDSGIDTTHPDLVANLWTNPDEIPSNGIDDDHNGFVDDVHGYNFINNTGNNNDDYGHGTHVAGIIGAVGNNGIGVTGVNWNVKIMALKFLNYNGSGSTSNALRALNYAVQMGATISNNSWTSPAYDTALETGIRNAGQSGHIYVAAAGNLAQNLDTNKLYPASYALDNVVTVAALDSNNNLAGWSNYGQTVDIAAPGVDIYSTLPGGNYGYMSGTSMATPFVTGAIALVRDANPTWTAQQVIQRVLSTADTLSSLNGKINGGRLDLAAAIGLPTTPPAPPTPPTPPAPPAPPEPPPPAPPEPPAPPVPPPDLTGAQVTTMTSLISNARLNGLRVTFSEAIQSGSFTTSDVLSLTGPGGAVKVTSIRPVTGSTTQFDLLFAEQTRAGNYSLTLGTGILDLAGNALNQNGNGVNGETVADRYVGLVNFNPTTTYSMSNVPALVKDYNTTTFTMNIPDSAVIGAMRVTIKVSHGWMSDMIIKLRSPSGKEVLLASRRGGGGKGYNNTVFDDAATKSLSQGGGLFTGSFRPETAFSVLKGDSTKGTWNLVIEDKARGDAGTLLGWSISFDTASTSSTASSISGHEIAAVDPNLVVGLQTELVQQAKQSPSQSKAPVIAISSPATKTVTAVQPENVVLTSKLQQQKQQLIKAWLVQLGLPATVLKGVHVG